MSIPHALPISMFSRFAIYRSALNNPNFALMKSLLEAISDGQPSLESYTRLFGSLAQRAMAVRSNWCSDPWKELILDSVLMTETIFSDMAWKGEPLTSGMKRAVEVELRAFEVLYRLDARSLAATVWTCVTPATATEAPSWDDLVTPGHPLHDIAIMKARMDAALDWGSLVEELAVWHKAHGSGLTAGHTCLRWCPANDIVRPVSNPDPIRLQNLIGYEYHKREFLDNVSRFVKGEPALNTLLVGERGTGKSSTIKAVANEFYIKGLKLVELDRQSIDRLSIVFRFLGAQGGRYLLFIDDLSFEGGEASYKALKSAMEGSSEVQPKNVLICATSNRRHIVQEFHSDRTADEEVHGGDGLQEKLSLSDRFGLVLLYNSLNQSDYIALVRELAHRSGATITLQTLDSLALRWALNNGRSPRAAHHFIRTL